MNGDHFLLGAKIALGLFAAFCLMYSLWFERRRERRLSDRRPRVYIIGGSTERLEVIRPIVDRATSAGIEIAYDWTRDPGWSLGREPDRDDLRESAERCLDAVRRTDIVWLVVPRQKSEGSVVELGLALAMNKRIVVSGECGARNIFALLVREWDRFDDHEKAFEHVQEIALQNVSRRRET